MDTAENKDLNSSPEQTTGSEALTSVSRDVKSWLATLGLAALIVLAIFLYRANRDSNEAKASRMLGEARNVQALQAIMSQYPSAAAARLALLQMAKAQYDNGDYAAAQASYTRFRTEHPSHPMVTVAELGLVHCTEGMGQVEQALKAYSDFLARNPQHYLSAPAMLGKARCLQSLKRYSEARAVYEDFMVSHPQSQWQPDIDEALKQMEREIRLGAAKP